MVDSSLQTAYIHHIRRAEHFVYIENQYFLGSSHVWNGEDRHRDCTNLVPLEIVSKIVTKIQQKERFSAYVMIPLHPEGRFRSII